MQICYEAAGHRYNYCKPLYCTTKEQGLHTYVVDCFVPAVMNEERMIFRKNYRYDYIRPAMLIDNYDSETGMSRHAGCLSMTEDLFLMNVR
jgi:hypothetical protein